MPMKHPSFGACIDAFSKRLDLPLPSLLHTPNIYSIDILTVIVSSDYRKVQRDSAPTLACFSKSTSQRINQSTNQSVFRCAHNSWIRQDLKDAPNDQSLLRFLLVLSITVLHCHSRPLKPTAATVALQDVGPFPPYYWSVTPCRDRRRQRPD